MSDKGGLFFENLLQQDYRGVNIAVYAVATAGLSFALHKIRPVSKFSKASKIPNHFIRNHEKLQGVYAGVQHSPLRILVDHKAPIYLPLWHSSKPPLPVKLWGVDIVSGNAVNWLECVATGKNVTLTPILRENEDLVSNVMLHLPQHKVKMETLDIGRTLVELGFAKTALPEYAKKDVIQVQLAKQLLTAEAHAKSQRNGIWSEKLPPLPVYVIYWRKVSKSTKEILLFTAKKSLEILFIVSRSALAGVKTLALKPFKRAPKQIQTT